MKAPMSENVKAIVSNAKKSKALSGQILYSLKTGKQPVYKVGGKSYALVRASSITKSK
jgi:hypothetical protein